MFFISIRSALADNRAPPLTFFTDVDEETEDQCCNQSSRVTEAGNKEIAPNRIMNAMLIYYHQ